MTMKLPDIRPRRPYFSSGPCAKIPGWSPERLAHAVTSRSHRSKPAKARLQQAITLTREVLQVPDDYKIAIVPASDTGAVEMALWNLLGARGVDVLAWESFGMGWANDVTTQLKLQDVRRFDAPYGELPELAGVDCNRDMVFTWNGTTSGVRVPDARWIDADRAGLTICDATSAVFSQQIDLQKIDVLTFSWQKALGGEAAHGMLILSPRAQARLLDYQPPWPLPKIFRLTKSGTLIEGVFRGETINTPSMLAVEDYIASLEWARDAGGLDALIARADRNARVVDQWVAASDWITHLVQDPSIRSNTSVCLKLSESVAIRLGERAKTVPKEIAGLLEERGVAFDIATHRDAPSGLRIWCGPTVETSDIEALLPWLDWAFAAVTQ